MATQNGTIQDTLVVGHTGMGSDVHAKLMRLTRYAAVFEIYNSGIVLRTSQAFENLRIVSHEKTIYSGRAIIHSVVDAGLMLICEVKLDESSWLDLQFDMKELQNGELRNEFQHFIIEWQKLYKISPEFKITVADIQSFLSDLRLWLDQIELNIRSQPSGNRVNSERCVLQGLSEPILNNLFLLFERFEHVTANIEKELQPAHALYAKRLIHPLVLCSPFMHRTFCKPLGYAGDYEMVAMMTRDSFQGGSVFAKILNTFFLNTPPVVAHRNRITYLTEVLTRETNRIASTGKTAKVLNLGCGPAVEIQSFLEHSPAASRTNFTLLDFNDETVEHTSRILKQLNEKYSRNSSIQVIKKSVAQLLKDYSNPVSKLGNTRYDIVYCAGLFDYLTDPICAKLLELFYELVSPGGVVVATNVDVSNPSRGWMEYMVDWHLCYRNSRDMAMIMPKKAPEDSIQIISDSTGVNVMVEARKPANA